MKHPNLAAEFEATTGCDMKTFESLHGIPEWRMNQMLYGDAEISLDEAKAFYQAFGHNADLCGPLASYSVEYLFSEELAVVEPDDKETPERLVLLEALVMGAMHYDLEPLSWLYGDIMKKAKRTLYAMTFRQTVTYAAYRNAACGLVIMIKHYEREERKRAVRESYKRRVAVS